MNSAPSTLLPTLAEAAAFTPQQVLDQFRSLHQQIDLLKHRLDWFKHQRFGQKSEKRLLDEFGQQMSLGEALSVPQTGTPPDAPTRTVAAQPRCPKSPQDDAESTRFFDEARVPMEVIELANPDCLNFRCHLPASVFFTLMT